MATALGLYNAALIEIGEGVLSSITEARKPRFVIDAIYDEVIADCLESGDWNFATAFARLDGDTGIAISDTGSAATIGYRYGFEKPTTWLRTTGVSLDENFIAPLNDYADEGGLLYADSTPIYFKWVSNDTGAGLELARWPRSFTRYVEVALADRIVMAITQNAGDKERLETVTLPRAKRDALHKDARNEGTKFRRVSSWNAARSDGNFSRERGNTSRFTG